MNWPELAGSSDGQALPDSYFVFGLHKCGSTLMHKMVRDVCIQSNIPILDIPALAFKEGIAGKDWSADDSLTHIFKQSRHF